MGFRSKFISLIQNYVRKIKRDNNYTIDKNILFVDFVLIIKKRIYQQSRGWVSRIFGIRTKGNLFIGKSVTIDHKAHLKAGVNLIIEDNVYINALGVMGISIGDNVTIQRNSILICTGVIQNLGKGIIICDNVGINARAYIGGQGGVTINKNVIIGPDVKIFSENHVFDNLQKPIKQQGEKRNEVIIKEDCWIGAGAILLAGVVLGKGCIVAAGSVVNKSFPDYSIIGGVPAKLLKSRQ